MILGIDASNIKGGGGSTHINELILNFHFNDHNISKIIIWGSSATLSKINNYQWLIKISPKFLAHNSFVCLMWQKFLLSKAAKNEGCDLIFVPGGTFISNFRPFVTISQNMLPFENDEIKRFGFSRITIRLILLRILQTRTFQKSNGIIFLTQYAKNKVTKVTGSLGAKLSVISHGINPQFFLQPRIQLHKTKFTFDNPIKIIYVSTIDHYKHQWKVIHAISELRREGYPVSLKLVGSFIHSAKKRLIKSLNKFDKNNEWASYIGLVPYKELEDIYKHSDLAVFASSCENLPIILIEKMASGLPIACSNKGPMTEVLGTSGMYFNPEKPSEIKQALIGLIDNVDLRTKKSKDSFNKAQKYSWTKCSHKTFSFFEDVYFNYQNSEKNKGLI
jgi:glycosyltransferase involved in cell wall biosynthesis